MSANDPGTRKEYHYILGNEAADYHNDLSAGDGFGVPRKFPRAVAIS